MERERKWCDMDEQAAAHRPVRRRAAPFRTLAEQLRRDLSAGRWSVGSRLPPVSELATTHGLGVNTVRRAIDELVTEGLLRTRQGSGAHVVAVPEPASASMAVGLITPNNRQRGEVIDSVESVLRAAGVNLLLASTDYEPAAELARARSFVASGVDGLLVVPTIHRDADPIEHLDGFTRLGVPCVFVERRPHDPPIDARCRRSSFVCADVGAGVVEAVCHLVDRGRSRIGFHGMAGTPHSAEVFAGYQDAVTALGLPSLPSAAVMHRREWSEHDMVAYAEVVAAHELDAVFCGSDHHAARLLPHLRRLGLHVPDTVAVVTFNDLVAATAEVPLTTVAPARSEVGTLAARALLRAIDAGPDSVASQTLVLPRLVVRASSTESNTTGVEARIPTAHRAPVRAAESAPTRSRS